MASHLISRLALAGVLGLSGATMASAQVQTRDLEIMEGAIPDGPVESAIPETSAESDVEDDADSAADLSSDRSRDGRPETVGESGLIGEEAVAIPSPRSGATGTTPTIGDPTGSVGSGTTMGGRSGTGTGGGVPTGGGVGGSPSVGAGGAGSGGAAGSGGGL